MMTTDIDTTSSDAAEALSASLDLLLTDAAFGALTRLNPGGSGLRLAAHLAARPRLVAGRGRHLLGEMARIVAGTSQVKPSRRDRRFADPGWAGNPLLRRVMQTYLATAETAGGLAADADLDWADTQRVGWVLENLVDAMAPSNKPGAQPGGAQGRDFLQAASRTAGTLITTLVDFKTAFDANAPLRDALAQFVAARPQAYRGERLRDLCQRICGQPLSHKPLLTYLRKKYEPLYGI